MDTVDDQLTDLPYSGTSGGVRELAQSRWQSCKRPSTDMQRATVFVRLGGALGRFYSTQAENRVEEQMSRIQDGKDE